MADSKKYNGSTWQHSLRKLGTATDTLTTLPADLYADGNNATVGLVGNMSQTGTPTPQNPITPSECGDLETEGAKAGQYKSPISSANTTTPIYLSEVESTRRIKKYEMTGLEDWRLSSSVSGVFWCNNFNNDYDNSLHNIVSTFCTHYKSVANQTGFTNLSDRSICLYCYIQSQTNYHELYIRDTSQNTLADFKTYLQQQYANGSPVTVWYVLATETTGIVNEPLRKIGNYADTVSGISIPTITGADSFDVLTTLKPSEVSLTYTGWHDASVKEWDGSQWQ